LDAPVKSYADVVYQQALIESAGALRTAIKNYLTEAAARQSANLPLGGPQVQAIVNLHVQHVERCMEARLDSYQQAFSKADQVPSEQDFADMLGEVNAAQQQQASHSSSSLIAFVKTRGIQPPGDPTARLISLSGNGHGRVLGVWKIWREGVRLQRSATPPVPTDPLPEKQRPERSALGWFWEKLWRWEVVAIGSTAIYGAGIAAMYGDDYLVAVVLYVAGIGWLTAKTLGWEETRAHQKRGRISVLVLLVAFLAVAGSLFWIWHRRRSHDSELSRTQSPMNKDKEIVEQHRATDGVTLSVDRSHRKNPVSPKTSFSDATQPPKAEQDDRIASETKVWIAEQLGVSRAKVVPGARLVEDLGADPLDKMELQMSLEQGFDIQIPDAKWREIRTVQDVIDYVHSQVELPKENVKSN
jgi:acyl carrier protein